MNLRSLLSRSSISSVVAAALTLHLRAAPRPYHLELQSTPSSMAPILAKFGTIEVHVFPGGVRVESLAMDSFSRNGSATITLLNPVARMYADVPVNRFPGVFIRMGVRRAADATDTPTLVTPVAGKVNGIAARRYRLLYSKTEWIDIWTTTIVPENSQLRKIIDEFVRTYGPGSAPALRRIPGNPLYVEVNTQQHPHLPLVRFKSLRFDADGEGDALRVGAFYFRAPLIDAIWK
ncbi:MAG: hypothetical protein ACXVJT_09820 [Thermoanaerobaculia bacterium]